MALSFLPATPVVACVRLSLCPPGASQVLGLCSWSARCADPHAPCRAGSVPSPSLCWALGCPLGFLFHTPPAFVLSFLRPVSAVEFNGPPAHGQSCCVSGMCMFTRASTALSVCQAWQTFQVTLSHSFKCQPGSTYYTPGKGLRTQSWTQGPTEERDSDKDSHGAVRARTH